MLKVIDEAIDKTNATFIFDRPVINTMNLHSLLFKVKTPLSFNIIFDSGSSPTVQSMIDVNYPISSQLSSLFLTGKDEFEDGIYEFDMYILYKNLHNIVASKGTNIITAEPINVPTEDGEPGNTIVHNILTDFLTTDLIYLGNRLYTIDKDLSTLNRLVLTEPLEEDVVSYKVVQVFESGFFCLYRDFNNWLVDKINKITNCINCTGRLTAIAELTTYILGLVHNIECQDLVGTKTIFNYIKQVQKDDNCC